MRWRSVYCRGIDFSGVEERQWTSPGSPLLTQQGLDYGCEKRRYCQGQEAYS